jgi:plastocyanin
MIRRVAGAALLVLSVLVAGRVDVTAQASTGSVESVVTDDKGKPIGDAVVSLMPLGTPPVATAATAAAPTTAVMDQHDKEFVPYVLPIYLGARVSFPNRDNIRHHVYSFSPAKKFELPLYMGTPASPVAFDKPGVVALGCNIHDWMLAYIYVLTTPHFAKTGADGKARLDGLSPGNYEARVWHPRLRGDTEKTGKPLTVAPNEPAQTTFVVSLKSEWRIPRRNVEPYRGSEGG